MTQPRGRELLDQAVAAVGRPLLGFMLGVDVDTCDVNDLPPEAASALDAIQSVLTGPLSQEAEIATLRQFLRLKLVEPHADKPPVALQIFTACGGTLPQAPAGATAKNLIALLARDLYPAFLLPADELPFPSFIGPRESALVFSAVLGHPRLKQFEAAVLADAVFGKIFGDDHPNTGRTTHILRSTGHGGGLQLSMLAQHILSKAWNSDPTVGNAPSFAEFPSLAMSKFDLMRSALAGSQLTVTARQAFTGVLLPPGSKWPFGKGVSIRATSDHEREFAPDSLKGQLAGTDASGRSTVINYDGDLVAEMDYPFKVRARGDTISDDETAAAFAELASANTSDQVIARLQLSLLLAVPGVPRVQIVPTWRIVDDPFDHGLAMSWRDPRHAAVGLMPTQLTEDNMQAWQEWFTLLDNPDAKKLSIAISRVVRAASERREPSDVLIDSVVAWENIFGTKEEPTLRVTASLAWLLEADADARRARQTEIKKIYALRSDVVHGSKPLKPADYAKCNEALDVAIQAIRTLLRDRTDVLAESDAAGRSLRLMMGQ